MDLAGCTTRVAVCDDTGVSGGLTVLPALPQILAVLAALLICALLVRRHVHRRRQVRRPVPRRVWVSTDGSVVEEPAAARAGAASDERAAPDGPGLTTTGPT